MMTFVIGVAVLFALYLFLIYPCKKRPDDSALLSWFYAHRGLHDGNKQVIENSMEAFRLAVEKGYGMELDVQCTKDGRLIVHHDGNLKRICGVEKKICEVTYGELCEIPLPDGSRIPLLTEVLDMVDGKTPLIVEVKREGGAAKNAAATWEILKNYQGAYCVESFDPLAMLYFRKHAPHILRGQLADGAKWDKSSSLAAHLLLKYLLVNVISRPHFVAYSVPEDRNLSMYVMKHLFRPRLACWTVRSQQVLDDAKAYHYPIFELFTPKK